MVPVVDSNNVPLMPCSEKRARQMMEKNQAKPWHQKGFFCIKLLKEPSTRNYQDIALGLDTGSKREAYNPLTKKAVIFNLLTNTPDWIKRRIENRSNLRRTRRNRKTPYRKKRVNRSALKLRKLCPSIKARWDIKIKITRILKRIIPISILNIEDIKAPPLPNNSLKNKRYNLGFCPLEIGKDYFYEEIKKLGIKIIITPGYETAIYRKQRGFNKLPKGQKLDDNWEAHNVDSHCLAEMALGSEVNPYKTGILRLDLLQFHKRRLHKENYVKGGFRRCDGSTVSLGMSRGSILRYKNDNKLYYLGGTDKGFVTINNIEDKKRKRQINIKSINILYRNTWRIHLISKET